MGDLPSNGALHPAVKSMKRTRRNKREFIGWGSASLIEFLISNGKDPSQTRNLYDVNSIINEYITTQKLAQRKKVTCDERLYSIFGKKSVNRTKILSLLEPHLLECLNSSEDEELSDDSEEGEGASNSCKRQRRKGLDKTNGTSEIKVAPRSCYASIITQNIKLVYLKRSLVQKLSETLDSFDGKVTGSFVRVKSDPNDYLQKNSHQLLQVTGIQKASETGDSGTGIILRLSNMSDGVQIRMLSDDDFTEEECKDLCQRVKDGQVNRLTTWDLEGKAKVLHQDITNHWIDRELELLQNQIERASEKGWQKERFEYIERRELLLSSSEKERLLQEVPLVIADEIEVEPPAELPADENLKTDHSPRSIPAGPNSKSNGIAYADVQSGLNSKSNGIPYADVQSGLNSKSNGIAYAEVQPDLNTKSNGIVYADVQPDLVMNEVQNGDGFAAGVSNNLQASVSGNLNKIEIDVMEIDAKEEQNQRHSNGIDVQQASISGKQWNNETNKLSVNKDRDKVDEKRDIVVIDLDDDDDDDDDACGNLILDNPESSIWFYIDQAGKEQGPFSMKMLKGWKDKDWFDNEFKVWKRGQTKEAAILLTDAISQVFPRW